MTYSEATEFLFCSAPLFQNVGAGAYKEGLSNTHLLDEHFGHPHRRYRTIHVAGTNGKGSVSHTLAAILQRAGLRVGLYTSPHLIDFRERIRVNGQMIPQEEVIRFVQEERPFFEPLHPSFFELATAMALRYFAEQEVDVAVIEVGLGGRLDCTNIIQPDLSVITNISFDHTQFLGSTLQAIAGEKAGIIKADTPVVIGETNGHPEVRDVFLQRATELHAPIVFADEEQEVMDVNDNDNDNHGADALPRLHYRTRTFGTLHGELTGECQTANMRTILEAVKVLRTRGYALTDEMVQAAVQEVCQTTGLMGRWQTLRTQPRVVCDTGHNVGGWEYLSQQLRHTPHQRLHIVMGMVSDKDIRHVLSLMPQDATYYFTQASVQRAMPVEQFAQIATEQGLHGTQYPSVAQAYQAALAEADAQDLVFVGGSTFIVADLLATQLMQ